MIEGPVAPLVLVVDDDIDIREMLGMIIESYGFRVVLAAHGKEALELIDACRPDAMVLDMKMPVMDGWELCRVLGERGDRPPTVIITAATDAASRARDVAAEGWISKPFDVEALVTIIRRIIAPA